MAKVSSDRPTIECSDSVLGFLVDFIKEKCKIPTGIDVALNNLSENYSLGIFPKGNAEILERDVTGYYDAEIQFQIIIKRKSVTDAQRLQVYDIFSAIKGVFVETTDRLEDWNGNYMISVGDYSINGIKVLTNPSLVDKQDDSELVGALYKLCYKGRC